MSGARLTRYLRDTPVECAHVQVCEHTRLVFVPPRSPPCPPPSSPQLHLSQVPSEPAAPFSLSSALSQVSLLGVPTGFCSFPLSYFLIAFPVSHNSVYFNTAHVNRALVNKLKLSLNPMFPIKAELVSFLRSLSPFRNAFHPVQNVAFLSKALGSHRSRQQQDLKHIFPVL